MPDGREVDQAELLDVAKDEDRARSLLRALRTLSTGPDPKLREMARGVLRGDLTAEQAFTDPEYTAALFAGAAKVRRAGSSVPTPRPARPASVSGSGSRRVAPRTRARIKARTRTRHVRLRGSSPPDPGGTPAQAGWAAWAAPARQGVRPPLSTTSASGRFDSRPAGCFGRC